MYSRAATAHTSRHFCRTYSLKPPQNITVELPICLLVLRDRFFVDYAFDITKINKHWFHVALNLVWFFCGVIELGDFCWDDYFFCFWIVLINLCFITICEIKFGSLSQCFFELPPLLCSFCLSVNRQGTNCAAMQCIVIILTKFTDKFHKTNLNFTDMNYLSTIFMNFFKTLAMFAFVMPVERHTKLCHHIQWMFCCFWNLKLLDLSLTHSVTNESFF